MRACRSWSMGDVAAALFLDGHDDLVDVVLVDDVVDGRVTREDVEALVVARQHGLAGWVEAHHGVAGAAARLQVGGHGVGFVTGANDQHTLLHQRAVPGGQQQAAHQHQAHHQVGDGKTHQLGRLGAIDQGLDGQVVGNGGADQAAEHGAAEFGAGGLAGGAFAVDADEAAVQGDQQGEAQARAQHRGNTQGIAVTIEVGEREHAQHDRQEAGQAVRDQFGQGGQRNMVLENPQHFEPLCRAVSQAGGLQRMTCFGKIL